jgi:catechol 2,3-dioxygenase-like lactoylglutathione lyase family enzyme
VPCVDNPVLELVVAITTRDYQQLVQFYCSGLGLEPSQVWPVHQGQATVLDLGRAALEIFDEKQTDTIDQLEAGARLSGPVRFALEVPDLAAALQRLLAQGGISVHAPVLTPWGDTSVRVQDPDGMQVPLFQRSKERGALKTGELEMPGRPPHTGCSASHTRICQRRLIIIVDFRAPLIRMGRGTFR